MSPRVLLAELPNAADPLLVDYAVGFFFALSMIILVTLIIQSFKNEGAIRRLYPPLEQLQPLSHERNARAQAYNTVIVLVGAAFAYYQFVYQKGERENEQFEQAANILYTYSSPTPARINAMDYLVRWAKERGRDGENRVAVAIADGLQVWAQKTNLGRTCENDRQFPPERIGSDTRHAIRILRNLRQRTARLDLSGLRLQNADLAGAGEDQRTSLRFVDFHNSDLSGAQLSFTDLRGADFYCANLYQANLEGSLAGAASEELERELGLDFDLGNRTNFVQTRMQRAILNRADFTGANLIEADMKEAVVDAGTRFEAADMQRAILENLRINARPAMEGANLNLACVDNASWAALAPTNFTGTPITYDLNKAEQDCQAPLYGRPRR